MDSTRRLFTSTIAVLAVLPFAGAALAAPKANHHNGAQLLGGKIKANGKHEINKKGEHTVSVEVKDGKVAAVHVRHAKKGDVAVTKYKSSKKLAQADGFQRVSYLYVQDTYLGTTYIGYAYIDDFGYEEIYWFPYDMVYNGDTGAIEYIPVT